MVLRNHTRRMGFFVFAIVVGVVCVSPWTFAQNNVITVTFAPFNPSGEKVNIAYLASEGTTSYTTDRLSFLYEIGQEIGISRARMQLFIARLMLIHKRYTDRDADRDRKLANLTNDNYIEETVSEFDELLIILEEVKKLATAAFTETQYGQFVTRIHQFFAFPQEHGEQGIEIGDWESLKERVFRELLLSSLYPIILNLSEQQQQDILDGQKKMFIALRRIQIEVKEQFDEYKKTATMPEDDQRLDFSFHQTIFDKFWSYDDDKVRSEVSQNSTLLLPVENPRMTQARERLQYLQHIEEHAEQAMRALTETWSMELNDILTDEQKTQLAQIREETPEYLREQFR